MLEAIKNANEIKVHIKSKNGYYVKGNKVYPFNLAEIDDVEIVQYIITNGEQASYEFDVISMYGDVYKYAIDDGGEYEFNQHTYVYSTMYFSREEFNGMCEKAQEKIREEYEEEYQIRDIWKIASTLKELYPKTFINISLAQVFCPGDE